VDLLGVDLLGVDLLGVDLLEVAPRPPVALEVLQPGPPGS